MCMHCTEYGISCFEIEIKKVYYLELLGFQGRVCNCNHKFELVTYEEELKMFTDFHDMDYNGQASLIASCIKVVDSPSSE